MPASRHCSSRSICRYVAIRSRVRSAERIVPPRPTFSNTIRYAPQLLSRPAWTWRYVHDGMPDGVRPKSSTSTTSIPQAPRGNRPNVTWSDIEWLRSIWKGPFVVKGILGAEDAQLAVDCGADALVVSNHGGRRLGRRASDDPSPSRSSPTGRSFGPDPHRRGSSAFERRGEGDRRGRRRRAHWPLLPLRPGSRWRGGRRRVLQLFHEELARTLKLVGRRSIAEIDESCIEVPFAPVASRGLVGRAPLVRAITGSMEEDVLITT